MARSKLEVRYQKARPRKKARRGRQAAPKPPPFLIRPRSPLAEYLFQEADSGLPVHELVEQFQEYDCVHEWGHDPIGVTEQENIFQCQECGLTKHLKRSGRTR